MTGFLAFLKRMWVIFVILIGLILGYCLEGPEGLPPDNDKEQHNGHN